MNYAGKNYLVITNHLITDTMNQATTTEDVLFNAIERYLKAKENMKTLSDEPKQPIQPIACKLSEYKEFLWKQKVFREDITIYKEAKAHCEAILKDAERKIRESIPCPLIWFVTNCESYAIAIHSSNWPGDEGSIRIEEKPVIQDLPKLELRIIN